MTQEDDECSNTDDKIEIFNSLIDRTDQNLDDIATKLDEIK